MMRPSTLRPFRATSTSIARTYLRCGTLSRPAFMSTTPLKTINVSEEFGDHSWRQQNHIWSETEIEERMKTFDLKHVPQSLSDVVLQKAVRMAYHTFNFAPGYDHADPPTSAIGYRLIFYEPFINARATPAPPSASPAADGPLA